MIKRFDPEVVTLAKLLVHSEMTTYEVILIHEEISEIPPERRNEFIEGVLAQANKKWTGNIGAHGYLMIFAETRRNLGIIKSARTLRPHLGQEEEAKQGSSTASSAAAASSSHVQ